MWFGRDGNSQRDQAIDRNKTMNVSSLSSASYSYDQLAVSNKSSTQRTRQGGNPMLEDLNSLQSALSSGDTSSAQSILSNILSHAPKSANASSDAGSTDTSSSNPADQITSYLKQIKSALSTGDTASAQSLVTSLKDYLAANPPPQPPDGGAGMTTGNQNASNPLEEALDSLESALSSGDTSTANSVLTEMLSHAPKSDSTSTDTADQFSSYLTRIQSALSSGDSSSAESYLTSLKEYLSANPPPPPPGVGTYAEDGSFSSSGGGSRTALSTLA